MHADEYLTLAAIDALLNEPDIKAPTGVWFCGVDRLNGGALLMNRGRDTFCHVGYDADLPVVIRERTYKRRTWQRFALPTEE